MMKKLLALVLLFLAAPLAAQTYVPSPSLAGMPPIVSEFSGLKTVPVPVDNGKDPLGAFRFICGAGQLLYDDPMVYPGQPGASHLHQFYGNTGANAYSTYSSLRRTGKSTCANGAYPLNRSGYWQPAMLDGKGHVVQPDYFSIYYKRLPASDPHCGDPRTNPNAYGICIPLPNGLRFIFGFDMVTNTPPTGGVQWKCIAPNGTGTGLGVYSNLAGLAAKGCPVGDMVDVTLTAPHCWDGKNLDSPNHRSHVGYLVNGQCPLDHPYMIPRFTVTALYSVKTGDDLKLWHLSSDEMRPGLAAGSTFHADFWEAWDNIALAYWTDGCINGHKNCSAGDLGNGFQLIGAAMPAYGWRNPNHLVPVPNNTRS